MRGESFDMENTPDITKKNNSTKMKKRQAHGGETLTFVNWRAADFSKPFQEAVNINNVINRESISWQILEESVTVALQFNVKRGLRGHFTSVGSK